MVDQTNCKTLECNQVIKVERGGRSVITCPGCNRMYFVLYEGKTPVLHNFGTNQATTTPATEKPSGNPSET